MSTGVCGECTKIWSLTKAGVLYKHPPRAETPCQGSGVEPVQPEAVAAAETLVKSGYTLEDIHEMLQNITPKRKKLRDRISGFIDNVRNYFNGAWDVFDDE